MICKLPIIRKMESKKGQKSCDVHLSFFRVFPFLLLLKKMPYRGTQCHKGKLSKRQKIKCNTIFNSRFPSWQLTPHSHKRSMCGSKLYLLFLNKKLSRFVSIQKQTFQNKLKSVTNSPFITHTTSLRQFFSQNCTQNKAYTACSVKKAMPFTK